MRLQFCVSVVICVALSCVTSEPLTGAHEYCAQETFNATCPEGHVVIMTKAVYGRMNFGRCMKEDHGHVGCKTDVLAYMDNKCSGKSQCSIPIPLAGFTTHPNCPSELMAYLEADYRCQKVQQNGICSRSGTSGIGVAVNTTYLSPPPKSIQHYPGSRSCPWVINTETGRTINISLLSFNTVIQSYNPGPLPMQCDDFVVINDQGMRIERAICKDQRREKFIYTSTSKQLSMFIRYGSNFEQPRGRYLLKLNAIGCADIGPVAHGWVKREDQVSIVKCNHSGVTFFLSCTGTAWIGELHNCSAGGLVGGPDQEAQKFPYGLLIVIGIGVALGVALGIILLAAILTCFKRKNDTKAYSQHTSDPLLSEATRDSEDGASNYYDRRSLATIGRTSRIARDPIYTERIQCPPHVPDSHMSFKCQTLPACGARSTMTDEELYCTCPQGANTLYERHGPRRQTSFVTFKPENGCVDVYAVHPDTDGSRNNYDTRSLDLIRESESQNMENMHRVSLTPNLSQGRYLNCNKCGIPVTTCPCRIGSSTMPRKAQSNCIDPTMSNHKSV